MVRQQIQQPPSDIWRIRSAYRRCDSTPNSHRRCDSDEAIGIKLSHGRVCNGGTVEFGVGVNSNGGSGVSVGVGVGGPSGTNGCCPSPSRHLLDRLQPVFWLSKVFGFYGPNVERRRLKSLTGTRPLTVAYSTLFTVFNVGMFCFNVLIVQGARAEYGLLHVETMTDIIVALKPLHNIFNLALFMAGCHWHTQLWRQLNEVDDAFRRQLRVRLRVRRARCLFFVCVALSFSVPFTARSSQHLLGETFGESLLADLSLLFVPLMSVWQLMPIFYYVLINMFLQYWLVQLRLRLEDDLDLLEHPLEVYYRLYMSLTRCVATMGNFFNPLAFFSLAISVVVMCLTIYFVTNANEISVQESDQILVSYYVLWSGLQIVVAIGYVLAISISGWRTNETARDIMVAVLSSKPADEESRFRVNCFINRNITQSHWGVTIWRAFPAERYFLFTLVSAISTYAVLLLKLRQKVCSCANDIDNNTASQYEL